ncbi:hypothetical protein EVG20_g3555 [Dentipellis fragilis]|uniref:Uncharacterized protein n=1 Tax=Dentipellis fragilis TaxID=205917 RepID=A0A4Y9Z0T4_9AGAM|nr:hypothetical protein EVG20_g3555 [Dentipellis fragilis]
MASDNGPVVPSAVPKSERRRLPVLPNCHVRFASLPAELRPPSEFEPDVTRDDLVNIVPFERLPGGLVPMDYPHPPVLYNGFPITTDKIVCFLRYERKQLGMYSNNNDSYKLTESSIAYIEDNLSESVGCPVELRAAINAPDGYVISLRSNSFMPGRMPSVDAEHVENLRGILGVSDDEPLKWYICRTNCIPYGVPASILRFLPLNKNSVNMSTKMPSPPTVWQRTPPEIWLSIFEHATFVPHAFDTDVADPFDIPETCIPFDSQIQDGLRVSLRTKRELVRVCRYWRDLATPILYRAVTVRDDRSLRCLRDALVRLAQSSITGSTDTTIQAHTLPVRVRRLDLSGCRAGVSRAGRGLEFDVICDLFSYLPCLEIFSDIAIRPYSGYRIDNSSDAEHHFLSLNIEYFVNALLANRPCAARCANCPRLSSLCVYWWLQGQVPGVQPASELPPLTSLSVDTSVDNRMPWKRPLVSLQHVYLWLHSIVRSTEGAEAFLLVQGPYLQTVAIDIRRFLPQYMLDPYLHLITTYCPNVVHLIFICHLWGQLSPAIPFPPTITHLGIYVIDEVYPTGLGLFVEYVEKFIDHHRVAWTGPGVFRRLNPSTEDEWEYLRGNAELRTRYASSSSPGNLRCRIKDARGRDIVSFLRNSG